MVEANLLERLMKEYGDSVFRMCFLYLKDYQLAEDATQETFIKAAKAYEQFQNHSTEKTWLIRIAINSCKSIMRTHWFQNMRNQIRDTSLDEKTDLFETMLEKDSLSRAIMKLPQSDRQMILLYYYQELSLKEISEIIEKPVNTVNQKLYRARQRLKIMLKGDVL